MLNPPAKESVEELSKLHDAQKWFQSLTIDERQHLRWVYGNPGDGSISDDLLINLWAINPNLESWIPQTLVPSTAAKAATPAPVNEKEDKGTLEMLMGLVRYGWNGAAEQILDYCMESNVTEGFQNKILELLDENNKQKFVYEIFEKHVAAPAKSDEKLKKEHLTAFGKYLIENWNTQEGEYWRNRQDDSELKTEDIIPLYLKSEWNPENKNT